MPLALSGVEALRGVGLRPVERRQHEERLAAVAAVPHHHRVGTVELLPPEHAEGVVRYRHQLRRNSVLHRTEANLLHARRRFNIGDKRVADAVETHFRALGRSRREKAAAFREMNPPIAHAHGKIIPFCRILRQTKLDVLVFGDNRHDRGVDVRERQTPRAGVESLRGVGEHLHAALRPRLERKLFLLVPVRGKARELYPSLRVFASPFDREADELAAVLHPRRKRLRQTLLREEPVVVPHRVEMA